MNRCEADENRGANIVLLYPINFPPHLSEFQTPIPKPRHAFQEQKKNDTFERA